MRSRAMEQSRIYTFPRITTHSWILDGCIMCSEPRGFAFVEFETREEVEKALAEGNGKEIQGNRVDVTVARDGRKYPDEMRKQYDR